MENQKKKGKNPQDLPSALKEYPQFAKTFHEQSPIIFLDFDGTLAPIVDHHDQAAISNEMRELVERLATNYAVAVVSGRGLSDVRKRVDLPNLYYAGSHGFEIAGPDDFSRDHEEAVKVIPVFNDLEPVLKEALKGFEGIDFERKKFTLAVHYRQLKQEHEEEFQQKIAEVLKNYPEVVKAGGKKVIEIKPAIDWHKGKAVNFLRKVLTKQNDPVAIYIGDDLTDEDAFEADCINIGILVGEHGQKSFANYRLEDVNEVAELLQRLVHEQQAIS
jgi:trehalose 6-phosphate phosphatase